MSTDLDLSFSNSFECTVLEELPGGATPRPHYYPPEQRSGQDGVIVRVVPDQGGAWIGIFAFGTFGVAGVSRVLSMPEVDRICVVARGAGYAVSALDPQAWEAVQLVPILDVRTVLSAGVIVFANYTEMLAYGATGLSWRTKRLAWDGLRIVEVGDRTLVGEYWDLRDEETRRFEVDLRTGVARGGVES